MDEFKELLEGLTPTISQAVEANILVKAIKIHYIKTIAELTNKPESEIQNELNQLIEQEKQSTLQKIKDNT